MGVPDRTAFRWFKSGLLQSRQMETGTLLMTEPVETPTTTPTVPLKVALSTRVSAAENQATLEGQAQRLQDAFGVRGQGLSGGAACPRRRRRVRA